MRVPRRPNLVDLRAPQGGFTYVGLLLALALMAGAAATTLDFGATMQRKAAEEELLFVGEQYRRAIRSYHDAAISVPRYPKSLEDLLKDPRFPGTRRHLRQLYADPITQKSDWGTVPAPGGGIMGVYSLSNDAPIKVEGFEYEQRDFNGKAEYGDWKFVFVPGRGTAGR